MVDEAPLAGPGPLVDVHAHFFWPGSARSDWPRANEARMRAGERIGITVHIASILGSWGLTSPVYLSSPDDVSAGNDAMLDLQRDWPDRIRSYVNVNPNFSSHALDEIARCVERGAAGIKIAASRRADDPLLDVIAEEARKRRLPVLHHIWQYRRRDWPGQDASDAVEYGRLAERHPEVSFILAHIGGGGDWGHTLAAIGEMPNVYVDLSGSGVDRGMLDATLASVGAQRMLWGCDVTMETGLAKWRALEVIAPGAQALEAIRWRSAVRIFPSGRLPGIGEGSDA